MTNELMNAIVSAITGAVAGGMVNLLLDKRKENLEDIKEKKKIYEDRPELQIIEYKEYIKCSAYKFKKECDINLFMTKMGKVSVENDIVRHIITKTILMKKNGVVLFMNLKMLEKQILGALVLYVHIKKILCFVMFLMQK